jgi:DNA (cytosine-5)-methyltransferase 1
MREPRRDRLPGSASNGHRLITVDLFCGAGGMSLGFEQAGFDVVAALDNDPINVATYRNNFPAGAVLHRDAARTTGAWIRKEAKIGDQEIDVVFGGPPCQGFSFGGLHQEDDPRNELLKEFARLVAQLQPRYFILENVRGLLRHDGKLLDPFLDRVARAGYIVAEPVLDLNAQDFGVPQRRRRVFILGWRRGLAPLGYPARNGTRTPTVADAIADLPDVDRFSELLTCDAYKGELGVPSEYAVQLREPDQLRPRSDGLSGCGRITHRQETIRRFAKVPQGGQDEVSRFYRLLPNGVAPTLRAGTGPSQGSFTAPRPIHPTRDRCITVREAARLHSLPDWFSLHSTKWHGFRQVGNSVPPNMARAVADQVASALVARAEPARRKR